jgi:hypothetical protein
MSCGDCARRTTEKVAEAIGAPTATGNAIWTSPAGTRFTVTSHDVGHGGVGWTARRAGSQVEICSGTTDKPTDADTRALFVEEIKSAVDDSAWLEAEFAQLNPSP